MFLLLALLWSRMILTTTYSAIYTYYDCTWTISDTSEVFTNYR
jgi:hypothetical protein